MTEYKFHRGIPLVVDPAAIPAAIPTAQAVLTETPIHDALVAERKEAALQVMILDPVGVELVDAIHVRKRAADTLFGLPWLRAGRG